jgi:hypothetical protein
MRKICPLNIFLSKSLHNSMYSVINSLGLPITKNKNEAFLIIEDIKVINDFNSNIIDHKNYLFVGENDIKDLDSIEVFSFDEKLIYGNLKFPKISLTKNKQKRNIFYLNLNYDYTFNNYVRSKTEFFVNNYFSVNEGIVSNNKKRLFDIIEKSLMIIFEENNLPFLHIWQHRKSYNSSFIYRLDCDGYHFDHVKETLSKLNNYSNFISVFINLETYKNDIHQIGDFIKAGYDIQTHNYFHFEYPTYYHSYNNLKKSCDLLNEVDIYPQGYASPDHYWYPHIIKIAEKLNFKYVTSCGFIYDGFPFFHLNDGKISKIIEIPFHPINPNRFKYKNILPDSDFVDDYYDRLIKSKISNNELIALYDHPETKLNKRVENTISLFQKIESNSDCNILNVSNYANWINKRLNTNYTAFYDFDLDKIIINESIYSDFELCIKNEFSNYLYEPKNNFLIKEYNRKIMFSNDKNKSKIGNPVFIEDKSQIGYGYTLREYLFKYSWYYSLNPSQIKRYLLKNQIINDLNTYKKKYIP